MSIFFELHRDIPREGPGLNESTLKAFHSLENLPQNPVVLDIGCGPGMQSLVLANVVEKGKIYALDTHEPFLEVLALKAKEKGLEDRVQVVNASMFELPFEAESFDLIWSEGSIYIMGFEEALTAWKPFIKTGGYMVVSEISWLHQNPDPEIKAFWEGEYPKITTISGNIKRMEEAGYAPVGHFVLPEAGWWDDYYNPLLERVALLKKKYPDELEENLALDLTVIEIEMYRKYASDYGYVFYLMEKI